MRLTAWQRVAILESVREICGEGAQVRLFGSRADDSKKGGDIDLYIEMPGDQHLAEKLYARICMKLGDELPIDLVIRDPHGPVECIHLAGMKGIAL